MRIEAVDLAVGQSTMTTRVDSGQVLGVVAAVDADGTRFLRALAGQCMPATGQVTGAPSAAQQAWIPRDNGLAATLTAMENIAVPLIATGTAAADAVASATACLERVGLHDVADRLVEELSGGQQQRVAVARAVARPVGSLFADAPTSALDALNRRRVLDLLRGLADSGELVVISATDVESLGSVADLVVNLDAAQ